MRWIFRAVVAIIILGVVLVGAVFLLPAERVAALASDQIRAATGRELTLGGRIRPSIWPQPGVSLENVALSNADWAGPDPMLRAEALSVGLDLTALLAGDIKVREITVQGPDILLEKAADGRVNWAFGDDSAAAQGDSAGGQAASPMTIDVARIKDGRVRFIDHAAGTAQTVEALNLDLALPDYTGPAKASLTAEVNGQPMALDLNLAQAGAFLNGALTTLKVELVAGAAKVAFDGNAALSDMTVQGALTAELGDLSELTRLAGAAAPLPAGVAPLSVAGTLGVEGGTKITLDAGQIAFGGNRLNGNAVVALGDKPTLTGDFSAGNLDLSAFTGGDTGGGTGGGASTGGWSTDPIDVSALGLLDANVGLVADSIDLGPTQLGATRLRATLQDRRIVFDIAETHTYDGVASGQVVVNGRGGLSVAGDLTLAGMAMKPLLTDFADFDRLSTSADMRLKVTGAGNSVDAIMNSLSGDGAVNFGAGELGGVDINGSLRKGRVERGADTRTLFNAIAATFNIQNGDLVSKDLVFDSGPLDATAEMLVKLGAQKLDLRIVPVAFANEEAGRQGIKVPLKISGPWSNLSYSIDLEAIVEERKDAKIEEKKEELKAQAAEKLGVEVQEGETLEDAAKRKLKDKAKKKLLKILE